MMTKQKIKSNQCRHLFICVNDEAIIKRKGKRITSMTNDCRFENRFQANRRDDKITCRSVSVEVGICFPPDG